MSKFLFPLVAFLAAASLLRADDDGVPNLAYLLGTHHGRGTLETVTKPPFRKATTSTIHVTGTITFHPEVGDGQGRVHAITGNLKIHGSGKESQIVMTINPRYAWVAKDKGHLKVELNAPLLKDERKFYCSWSDELPVHRDDAGRTLHIEADNVRRGALGSKTTDLRKFVFNVAPNKTHVRIITAVDGLDPLYDPTVTQIFALEFDY